MSSHNRSIRTTQKLAAAAALSIGLLTATAGTASAAPPAYYQSRPY